MRRTAGIQRGAHGRRPVAHSTQQIIGQGCGVVGRQIEFQGAPEIEGLGGHHRVQSAIAQQAAMVGHGAEHIGAAFRARREGRGGIYLRGHYRRAGEAGGIGLL